MKKSLNKRTMRNMLFAGLATTMMGQTVFNSNFYAHASGVSDQSSQQDLNLTNTVLGEIVPPTVKELAALDSSITPLTDEEITYLSIADGERIAEELAQKARADGEIYTLVKVTPLTSEAAVATKYIDLIPSGTSKGKTVGFSFSANTKIKDITITAAFSSSTSRTHSGPSAGQKVGGGSLAATHSYFIGVQYGVLNEYEYRVTNKYSGQVIRTEKARGLTSTLVTSFALGANIGNPTVTIENSNRNKTKTFTSHATVQQQYGLEKTSAIFW